MGKKEKEEGGASGLDPMRKFVSKINFDVFTTEKKILINWLERNS